MAREGSPERGGWQEAVVVGRLACAEAGKLRGDVIPVHFHCHRHCSTALVIMRLSFGIWTF